MSDLSKKEGKVTTNDVTNDSKQVTSKKKYPKNFLIKIPPSKAYTFWLIAGKVNRTPTNLIKTFVLNEIEKYEQLQRTLSNERAKKGNQDVGTTKEGGAQDDATDKPLEKGGNEYGEDREGEGRVERQDGQVEKIDTKTV